MVSPNNSKGSKPKRAVKAKPQPPQRVFPESRVNRICELAVGESESMARRLTLGKSTNAEAIQTAGERVRVSLSKAVQVASKRSGNTYTCESGQFFTSSGDIIVVTVATRTA